MIPLGFAPITEGDVIEGKVIDSEWKVTVGGRRPTLPQDSAEVGDSDEKAPKSESVKDVTPEPSAPAPPQAPDNICGVRRAAPAATNRARVVRCVRDETWIDGKQPTTRQW
jgi:hypothetical protein